MPGAEQPANQVAVQQKRRRAFFRAVVSGAYLILLILLFWSAATTRFRLPQWPLADRDTWGYLHPAVSKLAGGPFVHTNGRDFVYPAFLFVILWVTKSFRAIAIVQHSLGLGTGVLLLACCRQLGRFLRSFPQTFSAFLGLAVAAIYLLSSRPIHYESDLRPESITPFFALLNIWLTLRFFEQRHRQPPSNAAAWTAAFLLINSAFLAALKTSFALTVWFSIIPVLVALADRREIWPRRMAVLGAGLLAAGAVAIPESLLARSDPSARAFLPGSLFTIHANLIAQQMDEDLARGACGPYSCDWLDQVAASLHEEMAKSWKARQQYKSFHFDPDYLFYNRTSLPSWEDRFFAGSRGRMFDFFRYYYWRTVWHRPGAMAHKVITQMQIFYDWRNPSFGRRKRIDLNSLYATTVENLTQPRAPERQPRAFQDYIAEARRLTKTTAVIPQPLLVRFVKWLLSLLYLPVLGGVLLSALVLLARASWRRQWWPFAGAVLFLFSYNFGNTLGTAVVHSLHIERYSEAQYAFALLAVGGGILFLLDLAGRVGGKFLSRAWAVARSAIGEIFGAHAKT